MDIDLFSTLLFLMPGFFFVWSFGVQIKSEFEYFIFSLFWGIIFLAIYVHLVPEDKLSPLFNNPYAGAISFSIISFSLGKLFRWARFFF